MGNFHMLCILTTRFVLLDESVRVWNLESGKEQRVLRVEQRASRSVYESIFSLSFSPDGTKLCAACWGRLFLGVKLYN